MVRILCETIPTVFAKKRVPEAYEYTPALTEAIQDGNRP